MARAARHAIAGLAYHVVQRGHNAQAVCVDDEDRRVFIDTLRDAARDHGLLVHAYVLLPNEVELVATPQRPESMAEAIQALGRRYVRWFNRRHGRSGTIWNGRYRSALIEPERYLLRCQRHVELAPVRAGLAVRPDAWTWSSHRHHIGWVVDPLVRPHPTLWTLGNTPFERESKYRELFDDLSLGPDDRFISERSRVGKPIAGEPWQRALEQQHRGLKLVARPVGRPRAVREMEREPDRVAAGVLEQSREPDASLIIRTADVHPK